MKTRQGILASYPDPNDSIWLGNINKLQLLASSLASVVFDLKTAKGARSVVVDYEIVSEHGIGTQQTRLTYVRTVRRRLLAACYRRAPRTSRPVGSAAIWRLSACPITCSVSASHADRRSPTRRRASDLFTQAASDICSLTIVRSSGSTTPAETRPSRARSIAPAVTLDLRAAVSRNSATFGRAHDEPDDPGRGATRHREAVAHRRRPVPLKKNFFCLGGNHHISYQYILL